ncbi:uncharacterized protein [Dysidea avara]|uniref:uncharacterized protein isoform X2 n=1 Tax=Dysidea avara TaxID=196820 RepID=UPI0033334CDA
MKTRNCRFVLVNCLLVLQVTAAPSAATAVNADFPGAQKGPTKTKDLVNDVNKSMGTTEPPTTTATTTELPTTTGTTESPTTPSQSDNANKFTYHGEVALYYSGGGDFTVILIYPYLQVLEMINSSDSMNLSSNQTFNLYKKMNLLLLENSVEQDPSGGLIRVVKIGNNYTIDLNGEYPEEKESRFMVSEYLENTDGSPDANLLVLKSSAYSDQYLRWHDDGKVDCEPFRKDDAHYFYWKFALPMTTQIIPQMLPVHLWTDSNHELVFVHGSPRVTTGSTTESTNSTNYSVQ